MLKKEEKGGAPKYKKCEMKEIHTALFCDQNRRNGFF